MSVAPFCDVLVLAAFPPELSAFRAALTALMDREVAAGAAGLRVETDTVGVGLVAAGVGAARRLGANKLPRAVIMLGTCGAFRTAPRLAAGRGVVVGKALRLVEPAVLEGRAAFPGPMGSDLAGASALVRALAMHGGVLADVATTLGITTDDGLARLLAEGSGAQVEHLEAYAVAFACEAAGVPFAAVLGVANEVGASGRAEWRAHHQEASDAAAQVVLGWLRAGGGGLSPSLPPPP